MEVFTPALKDRNPFFDEIMFHSKNTFIFDNYKNYKPSYKIVLIHWPEQIFNWNEPSIDNLKELSVAIELWKQSSKIIYLVHNQERHYGMTPRYTELYNLIEMSCDCMIHFGEYGSKLYKSKYPSIVHKVIPHPLYRKSFDVFEKNHAREQLKIEKSEVVIIAPGSIRNKQERDLILRSFKNIPVKNKVLIVPRMYWLKFPFEFKGRILFKKVFDVKKLYEEYMNERKYKSPQYRFRFRFLKNKELSLLMSAADIVFIPRIKILNSGNVFLGLTYKKIIVAPKVGNITEIIEPFRLPCFEPNDSNSIFESFKKALEIVASKKSCYNNEDLKEFEPPVIAKQWDIFFKEVEIGIK